MTFIDAMVGGFVAASLIYGFMSWFGRDRGE